MKTRAAVLRQAGTPWEICRWSAGYHRRLQGSLFGGANPLYDIPMILGRWHEGHIKLTELITRKYTLDEINEGYADLMNGKNIRGVIVHQH